MDLLSINCQSFQLLLQILTSPEAAVEVQEDSGSQLNLGCQKN